MTKTEFNGRVEQCWECGRLEGVWFPTTDGNDFDRVFEAVEAKFPRRSDGEFERVEGTFEVSTKAFNFTGTVEHDKCTRCDPPENLEGFE